MQSFLSRIWTHVAVSISYDDNHNTTSTSKKVMDKNQMNLCFSCFTKTIYSYFIYNTYFIKTIWDNYLYAVHNYITSGL